MRVNLLKCGHRTLVAQGTAICPVTVFTLLAVVQDYSLFPTVSGVFEFHTLTHTCLKEAATF